MGQVISDLLHQVETRTLENIISANGVVTELYRPEWIKSMDSIAHMIQVSFRAFAVSAWHKHLNQTDHIVVTRGTLQLVLYDARESSPTFGALNVFHLSPYRPTLIKIPPNIWHGLKNLESTTSSFINYFDRPYQHSDPDEHRLPADTPDIPFKFH
jgi:dTDP-4-dehydrorhamnose 3,5-epimerase